MATKQKKLDKADQAAAAAVDRSPTKIQALVKYFEDAKVELGKVSWPTRKEVKVTSLAVLALVVVMSIFLGLADLVLSKIMESILSIGL
jgi:preprotein translocase subunit SecE